MQTAPAPQVLPAQQGCPSAPQVCTQLPFSQVFPALQLLFGGQQGAPAPPQPQVPLMHWSVLDWQVLFGGQHGCRVTPHGWQVPPRQPSVRPGSDRQVLLGQQTSPWPPHS
jgi:hypothetical protein